MGLALFCFGESALLEHFRLLHRASIAEITVSIDGQQAGSP